ncbi:unnamed protein product [Gordionus sp. m RMFG-2023]
MSSDIWEDEDFDFEVSDALILASQQKLSNKSSNKLKSNDYINFSNQKFNSDNNRHQSYYDLTKKVNMLHSENKTLSDSLQFFKHELKNSEIKDNHRNEQYQYHLTFIKEKYKKDYEQLKKEIADKVYYKRVIEIYS